VRVATVSLHQDWLDKDANKEKCRDYIMSAKSKLCDLIIFPEMTLTGYSVDSQEIAEPCDNSQTIKFFEKASKDHHIDVIFGAALYAKNNTELVNAMCLSSPLKKARVVYEKTHPFSYAGEDKFYAAGKVLGFIHFSALRFGAAICYDLRFPEIFSTMAREVDAFVIIANWPKKRIDHWFGLLKARAIENQCYAIGVNRIGCDGNDIEYEKSTVIFDPIGVMLNPIDIDRDMDIYQLDRCLVEKYRKDFPAIADKRYSLYQDLYKGLA
jgi:omega-amidase